MLPANRKVGKQLFKAVLLRNRSIQSDYLNLKISLLPKSKAKLSVVVPKKVEKTAVLRNSTKRRVYGVCRDFIKNAKEGVVYVFFVKKSVKTLSFSDLKDEIKRLFEKAGIESKIEL